ncbi:carboxymuconolactone decarboxylase family protein [Glaciibacter superstes]|uniref:carboxymuconolactone decarboxylase family protein n=1 Tax=Glaciibacter superstes TaxID=501023 RepID=UPI0003B5608C|nr:carboxymuconolactone decarboxylase family protein [Glaciibacter superstes]
MSDHEETRLKIAEAAATNGRSFRLYRRFADQVWAADDIDARTTEIIAVAVTHVTRCSTCVDFHSTKALALGVEAHELVEAGVLAAAVQTLAVVEAGTESTPVDPFLELPFDDVVTHLDVKTKALVVSAAAFSLKDSSLIARARAVAEERGASVVELNYAVRIAAALTAGAAIHFLSDIAHVYREQTAT